ncbi:hypothetical protein ACSQ76_21995 [Roseovarius sp. B08]|uniref:hypothetical protein n=1 Tax=Roseovarius sp. B08 TaxID=3449223 RepID=UPI003EDB9658
MTRICERQTDALFAKALVDNSTFATTFLNAIDGRLANPIIDLSTQIRHRGTGHRGSIDLEITRADGTILLVENKIDAGYSVTSTGKPQPERYRASVEALRNRRQKAASVLLAPDLYLAGTRHADAFDHLVSYEALRCTLNGEDLALLDAAIVQAATPYDPIPNASSGAFHADLKTFASLHFPELIIKKNPNGNGVRPAGSNTIYFDVPRTLKNWSHLPRPRMSLQCRDLGAPSASVKIMLGGMGRQAGSIAAPQSLAGIGGYIRPAGQSLGLVLDTPQLHIQQPFDAQVSEVEEGLAAARKLTAWWNSKAETFQI